MQTDNSETAMQTDKIDRERKRKRDWNNKRYETSMHFMCWLEKKCTMLKMMSRKKSQKKTEINTKLMRNIGTTYCNQIPIYTREMLGTEEI